MHAPMTHPIHEPRSASIANPGLPKSLVVAWLTLGLACLGYLVALAARPDLVVEYLPLVASATPEDAHKSSKGTAEVAILRQTIAELRNEVASLKSEVQAHQERGAELTARLAALEPKASDATPAPTVVEAPLPPAANAIAKKFSELPKAAEAKPIDVKRVAVVSLPPKAAPAAEVAVPANPAGTEAPSGIETGSIAPGKPAAPVAFGPAVVTPANKLLGVQIATGTSVDALRLSWSLLADRHTDLKNLQPRYTTGGKPDGEMFDLIAGPIKSQAEARKVCKSLQAKGVGCKIGNFEGNAL